MNNSISFFLPSPQLRDFIHNYYIAEFDCVPDRNNFEQRHLSNGCTEMFIGYQNTRSTCFDSDGKAFFIESGVVGAHNLSGPVKGLVQETGAKAFKFVSVNFRQNGFYNIFRIPGSETYNGFFDGSSIIGNDIEKIRRKLSDSKTNAERCTHIENFLIEQYKKNSDKAFTLCGGMNITAYIINKNGNVRVRDLMTEFNVSERTLERNFKAATGYPVKEFCKIVRFNKLLELVTFSHDVNWADMVSRFGYYDQSHLINEFRNATGIVPSVYCRNINTKIFRFFNHLAIPDTKEFTEAMMDSSANSSEIATTIPDCFF